MASFRMVITKNPSLAFDTDEAMDSSANWIADLSNWTFDGTAHCSVTTTGRIRNRNIKASDLEATIRISSTMTWGTQDSVVLMVRAPESSEQSGLFVSGGSSNTLSIGKYVNGTRTAYTSANIGGLATDVDVWLRIIVQGKSLIGEFWYSDPANGGDARRRMTQTLSDEDYALFVNNRSLTIQTVAAANVNKIDSLHVHPLEVDLAPFTRVAPGDGLDPANSGFMEPAFADAPLRDGGPLVNYDAKNREVVVPVHVSSTSKDGLHSRVQGIHRALQEPGAQIEWRDEDATRSTYLDVQAGRYDQEYNFRRAQKFWNSGTVHVWTLPFGHTNNSRIVGTLSASGAVQGIPLEVMSNDPSNMISSSDFELGVLGIGSWSAAGNGLAAGGSIMSAQSVPTIPGAFVGDYVMRFWADGTTRLEGVRVPFTFASSIASSMSALVRLRTSRTASYPMQIVVREQSGGVIENSAALIVGTAWAGATVNLSISAASLSGSYAFIIRSTATDIPSMTFEMDQAVLTLNGAPSLSIPSVLDGDRDARAVWQVTAGSYVSVPPIQLGRYIGVAALPASYIHQWPAASIGKNIVATDSLGVVTGASGADGSQYYNPYVAGNVNVAGRVVLPNAGGAYVGRNRVYAIGRSRSEPVQKLFMTDWEENRIGATVVASGFRDWHLYDFGVVNVPTAGAPSALQLTIYGSKDSAAANWGAQGESIHLNEIVVLPENNHALLQDDIDVASQIVYDNFVQSGATFGANAGLVGHVSESGHTWASGLTRMSSGVATAMQIASVSDGILMISGSGAALMQSARIPSLGINEFRTQFSSNEIAGTSEASLYYGIRKESPSSSWLGVRFGPSQAAAGGPYMALEWASLGAAPALVASVAVGHFASYPSRRRRLVADFKRTSVFANIVSEAEDTAAVVATIVGTSLAGWDAIGDPGFYMAAGSKTVSGGGGAIRFYDFRVESVPTQRIAARDVYVLDGVSGEAYRRTQGGDVQQRLTHKLRGQIPGVPVPSTARLVGFALGLPEGIANDLTDVQVQVREQFRFAR